MPKPSAVEAGEVSSVGLAIGLLGDRWTLLILRDAFLRHTRRFGGWRGALGISDPVLARRLHDLVEGGVLRRVPYSSAPERHEYVLTEAGLDLWAFLTAIWGWERRWVSGTAAVRSDLLHLGCGARIRPLLACAACRAVVGPRDTAAERSPGVGPARNAPPRLRRLSTPGEEPSDPPLMAETMALLGDRWSTVMVAAAFLRTRRFGDFQREIGVPPTILSRRLCTLVSIDVFRRVPSGMRSEHHEYRLTEKGLDFHPVMVLLWRWANRWMATPAGSPVRISHPACGAALDPVLLCDHCGEVLERREVRFVRPDRVSSA